MRQVVPDESLAPQLEQRRASDPSAAEPNGSAASAPVSIVSKAADEAGGAEGGTPELYFTDPDGILMQLQDVTYCGGGGYLGNECLAG